MSLISRSAVATAANTTMASQNGHLAGQRTAMLNTTTTLKALTDERIRDKRSINVK